MYNNLLFIAFLISEKYNSTLSPDFKEDLGFSYSLCDKFNLYSSDRSLCPLCLCGSFHSLPQDCILEYIILPTKPGRADLDEKPHKYS
jgi:hypothetical protein